MTDMEKRAHDIAIASLPVLLSRPSGPAWASEKPSAYSLYKEQYDQALDAMKREQEKGGSD